MKQLIVKNIRGLFIPTILATYAFGFLVIIGAILIWKYLNIPVSFLMKDTIAATGGKMYAGVISNLGAIFWLATVSITGFSYAVLRDKITNEKSFFLAIATLFTFMLFFDDFFMFHDYIENHDIFPVIIWYAFYGVVAAVYIFKNLLVILQSNFIFLFLALGLLGFSVFMDLEIIHIKDENHLYILEDGSKFLGIISWAIYHVYTVSSFFKTNH